MTNENFDKKILKDKVALMIRNQQLDESILKDMSVSELMEEINIYHQELIYQNEELSHRSLELEAEKARYQELFEDSPVGYLILDSDYIIQAANKTFSRFFDISKNNLIGKPISDYIHQESQDELYFMMQEKRKNGRSEAKVLKLATGINPVYTNLICNSFEHMGQSLIRAAFVDITKEYIHREMLEKELNERNKQYELAVSGSSAGIFDWDLKSDKIQNSKIFLEQLGYRENELPDVNSLFIDIIHPDEREQACKDMVQYFQSKSQKFSTELRLRHKNGSYRWFLIRGEALRDNDGNPYRMLGSNTDITERKEVEEALRISEEKYRLITENIGDVISIFNINQNCFTFFSPSVETLIGYTVQEALSLSFQDILNPEALEKLNQTITKIEKYYQDNRALNSEKVVEECVIHKNGESLWVETSMKARLNHENEIEILSVVRDIDKRKTAELEVEYLIYHDNLTGIYNRHYFDKRVMEEMSRSDRYFEPLSMIVFDLDLFKNVNDTWGHPVGDTVLKNTANIVKSIVRKVDVFARMGGEEFVILMPKTTEDGAYSAAEKIRKAVKNFIHPIAGVVTISLGIAQREPYESFASFYKRLDDAMYESKRSGRNCTHIASPPLTEVKIESINWDSSWNSGNQEIDNDHKDLIKIINHLIRLSVSGSEFLKDLGVLDDTLEKIQNHFDFEEKIQLEIGYPDYEKHSKIHKSLIEKAKYMRESLEKREILISDIISFIIEELIIRHMLRDDVQYFIYL